MRKSGVPDDQTERGVAGHKQIDVSEQHECRYQSNALVSLPRILNAVSASIRRTSDVRNVLVR